ncbi:MAG: DUF1749 domain-containing protein [Patescibacteria group bacterium]
MIINLEQITTKDGVTLEGLFFKPKKGNRTAAIWVSGLTGRFSNAPKRTYTLAESLNRRGIAFAVFDHRGLGTINTLKKGLGRKKKHFLAGTAFEKFEHSVFDIDAVIRFFEKRGYKKIFLLGHSTGANKIAYYYSKTGGRKIAGLGLLGPLSDIPGLKKGLGKNYKKAIRWAEDMAKKQKKSALLPFTLSGGKFWGAERFLSIAKEKRKEDTFPYYDPSRKFYWAKRVKCPILVLIGGKDQYADRPVKEILRAFEEQIPGTYLTLRILGGADHNFNGKEKELAKELLNWIIKARLLPLPRKGVR